MLLHKVIDSALTAAIGLHHAAPLFVVWTPSGYMIVDEATYKTSDRFPIKIIIPATN